MTGRGSRRPFVRLADRAGQLLVTVVVLIVTTPLWLLWGIVVTVLIVSRPFIVYPLALATLGGAFASAWFAYSGAWMDAAQAAVAAVISCGLFMAYVAFTDHIGFTDVRPPPYPPPWW